MKSKVRMSVWFPWKLCVHLCQHCLGFRQRHSLSTFWFCTWWCNCQLPYLQHQHHLSFCHKNKWCSVFSFQRSYTLNHHALCSVVKYLSCLIFSLLHTMSASYYLHLHKRTWYSYHHVFAFPQFLWEDLFYLPS